MSETLDTALAAYAAGDFAAAATGFEEALRETPDDAGALAHLAACYSHLGRYSDAVTAQTRSVQIAPGNAEARYQLALYLRASGWLEQARQAAEQALMLDPTHAAAQELVREIGAPTDSQAAPPQPAFMPNQVPAGIAQPYGAQPGAMPSYLQQPHVEDQFDLRQAVRDVWSVITSPNAFFMQQVGREGRKAPCALILLLAMIWTPCMAVIEGKQFGWTVAAAILVFGIPVMYLFSLITTHISARLLRMVAGWFGSTASLDSTFRAYVYTSSVALPMYALMFVIGLLQPPVPAVNAAFPMAPPPMTGAYTSPSTAGSGSPPPLPATGGAMPNTGQLAGALLFGGITMLLELATGIWFFAVLVIAVSTLHSIPSGTAAGVIVLAGFIGGAIVMVIGVIAGIAIITIVAKQSSGL